MNNKFSDFNDGCSARGACSINPSVASLQELLLYIVKQIAYYILKLDKLNLNNNKIIIEVVNSLSSLVLINELNEKNLYSLILQNYFALESAKNIYIKTCSERNINPAVIDNPIGFDDFGSLALAISEGNKLIKSEYLRGSTVLKNNIQILIFVLKSVCFNLSRLYDYNNCDKTAALSVFQAINILNNDDIDIHLIQEYTKILAKKDFELNLQLADELQAHFGKISETDVSLSTRAGKAILVSGNNFFDLLNVLELAKKHNIDVYTHSELLTANSLEKFNRYDNLIGHYGNYGQDCILDFGTFPGAILLTNNSQYNTEFLYRGRIYSKGFNIPQGVTKIENNDYMPLIKSAINSKGFSKGQKRDPIKIGVNEDELISLLSDIMEKLANSELKRLYILIGNLSYESQNEYLHHFCKNIKTDEFVLSFCYGNESGNVKVINLGNYYPLIKSLVHKVLENCIENNRIIFIFNNCGVEIISWMIYLREIKVKNIYVSLCSPRRINPSVFETLLNCYGIFKISSPEEDLKIMRNKE